MAITFIDSNTQDSAAGLSLTFAIPGGATTDDLILVFVKQCENTTQRIWDDDGGGGRGYTRLDYNRTTADRDQETAIYYKIHSGTETNPTFTWASGITAEPMSGSMLIYRGTYTITPISAFAYANNTNDANPPNPSVSVGFTSSAMVVFHAATHDDISAVAAPTGYALRTQVWNGIDDDHRNHFTADLLSGLSIGVNTPPDWQHTVLNNTPEYHTYSIVLQIPILISIEVFPEGFNYGDSVVIEGFGFEATKGTGKVELWSDISGTIKTTQTTTAWADDEITFTATQGSLNNNALIYIVVTNDNGDPSGPVISSAGLLDYSSIILANNPDHWWVLEEDYDDTGGWATTSNLTSIQEGDGGAFVSESMSEGTTGCWQATNDRRACANTTAMNASTTTDRLMGGWIRLGEIFQGLTCIYEEGGSVNNIAFFVGMGNRLVAQLADTNDDNVQAFSNMSLEPNRTYHILFRFSYTESNKQFQLYVDGVLQEVTSGNPLTSSDLDAHNANISFGGPGDNLEVAGTDVLFLTATDAKYSNWVTWSRAVLQPDIIKLFKRGAVPDVTITTDIQANMQTGIDALASTSLSNTPLSIRVENYTGAGDLSLEADGVIFDPLTSIYLEWRGAGILNWTNLNGSNLIADKVYTPLSGTVNIINPASLTLLGVVSGSEVRMYTEGATGELFGIESTNGEDNPTYQYQETGNIDIVIHNIYYQYFRIDGYAITGGDVILPVSQIFDRNYTNPT